MIKTFAKKFANRFGYQIEKLPTAESEVARNIIERGKGLINKISPQLTVLNGVFASMQYPTLNITEAALVPKIVGSYESQLHPIIQSIISTDYDDIIDVGCAEGYYAVGLAMKMPQTVVHGFDINEKDIEFCREMAKLNNVSNITFNNFCDPKTLIDFPFRDKGLVFCDCEGYELELFTTEVIEALYKKRVDVLVEMHDVLNPGITSKLIQRFLNTHDVQIVSTKDKLSKTWRGLEHLSDTDKEFAVFEHRGGINKDVYMEWAYFTCKE